MTERHAGYLVVLDHDFREDDAEAIVHALSMVKGVLSVEPVSDVVGVQLATARVRAEMATAVTRAVTDVLRGRYE